MTSLETLELEAVDAALAGRYVAPDHAELADLALLLRDRFDLQRRGALPPPQLVERRVAGDTEEPGALAAAAGVVALALAVRALEGERGHVLCCGAVVQQGGDVAEHVIPGGSVQRVEVERDAARWGCGKGHRRVHASTTTDPPSPSRDRPTRGCVTRTGADRS